MTTNVVDVIFVVGNVFVINLLLGVLTTLTTVEHKVVQTGELGIRIVAGSQLQLTEGFQWYDAHQVEVNIDIIVGKRPINTRAECGLFLVGDLIDGVGIDVGGSQPTIVGSFTLRL